MFANPGTGLMEVPAGGGEPKVLTTPDTSKGEGDHLFPEILPGGRAVLFTTTPVTEAVENSQIAVYEFDTKRYTTVVRGGSSAQYVALRDGGGLLVYTASNTLRAVRFDPVALKVIGDPVLAADHVSMAITGAGQFALAENGTLAHLPASPTDGGLSLAWVDRQGAETLIAAPLRAYTTLRLSPDASRVALDVRDQESDIWIWSFADKTLTRLTFGPRPDSYPVWAPGGDRVAFASQRDGTVNIYWQAANNTGAVERLTTSTGAQVPATFIRDGKHLLMRDTGRETGEDLSLLSMDTRVITPLLHGKFDERNGEISPDGRFIAHE